MKLFTKEIEAKAQAQYKYGADMGKQVIIAKLEPKVERDQYFKELNTKELII